MGSPVNLFGAWYYDHNYRISCLRCVRDARSSFPPAGFDLSVASPDRPGRGFAFPTSPQIRGVQRAIKGLNQPGLPYGMRARTRPRDAVTLSFNIP